MLDARIGLCVILAVAACSAVIGCGAAEKPLPSVHLRISAPSDGARVTDGSITLTGSVSPTVPSVVVLGRSVPVTGGAFTTRVALRPGTNIVDVLAGGARDQDAMAAVRVYRQVFVPVPGVVGDSPSSATGALKAAGLIARVQDDSSFFDFLLPNGPAVCSTSPAAGHRVVPGSVVTVTVSKSC
jgi:hypothetical protein